MKKDIKLDNETLKYLSLDLIKLTKLMSPSIQKDSKEYYRLAEEKSKKLKSIPENTPDNKNTPGTSSPTVPGLDSKTNTSPRVAGVASDKTVLATSTNTNSVDNKPSSEADPKNVAPTVNKSNEKKMIDNLSFTKDFFDELIDIVALVAESRNQRTKQTTQLMVSLDTAATRGDVTKINNLLDHLLNSNDLLPSDKLNDTTTMVSHSIYTKNLKGGGS